jgi:hypothetical protein
MRLTARVPRSSPWPSSTMSPVGVRVERRTSTLSAVAMAVVIVACGVYANLSFLVTNHDCFKYFPPYRANENQNFNTHLGGEYFNIASALADGEGFSNPFRDRTGPTAWMPPILPALLAGLLRLSGGNQNVVTAIVIVLQVSTLVVTGLVVLAIAQRTTVRLGSASAMAVYVVAILSDFRHFFQFTHDTWLVLLTLDVLLIGICLGRPLRSPRSAAGWGIFGGISALISPVAALAWGCGTFVIGYRERRAKSVLIAVLFAAAAIAPWMIRNYLIFGRFIPIKSNAAYELYQSQCVTPDGLLRPSAFAVHPYKSNGLERSEYARLGEMAFLDRKRDLFWESVRSDPIEFVDRVAARALGATIWYVPFERKDEQRRPAVVWIYRVIYPLPFAAFVCLMVVGLLKQLDPIQSRVLLIYGVYLSPYVAISYYDRYGMPLVGVKVLLVVWAIDWLTSSAFARNRSALSEARLT